MRILLAAVSAAFLCAPAAAHELDCFDRTPAEQALAETHGEDRRFVGLSARGWVVALWANDETGTWTAVLYPPGDALCHLDDGEGFTVIERALPEEW